MSFQVVTIYDEDAGRSRVAVVKTLEQSPDVWGVVAYYSSMCDARLDRDRMLNEHIRLEESYRALHASVPPPVHTGMS